MDKRLKGLEERLQSYLALGKVWPTTHRRLQLSGIIGDLMDLADKLTGEDEDQRKSLLRRAHKASRDLEDAFDKHGGWADVRLTA